ncbi:hypothetical protein NQ315_003742 [Exocentrus adspersus]|uniref:Uncharacterized protein n=1 Tax=Exocentrus adspersus TaxID=1586481 RepID=A0AAV8VHZ5_9CUCU|nr:hypothetical protein NQ315_003742 [Exocentrus adspersus]
MKCLVLVSILFILGVTTSLGLDNGHTSEGKTKVLKRIVKRSLGNLNAQILPVLEGQIIASCKNGEAANDLPDVFRDMKSCIARKQIIRTPKEEYLKNIEKCSQDAITKTKNCLSDEKKYFPDFLLVLVKSVVSFMYDDVDLLRVDLAACIPRISSFDAQNSYLTCVRDTALQTHDTTELPNSKAEFCAKFIPINNCFTDMIKDYCPQTSNLKKLREDYINMGKRPCGEKEVS